MMCEDDDDTMFEFIVTTDGRVVDVPDEDDE